MVSAPAHPSGTEPAHPSGTEPAPRSGTEVRPTATSVLVGVGLGVATWVVVAGLVGVLVVFLGRIQTVDFLDQPWVRTGILVVAPLIGTLAGIAVGVIGGRWYRGGGSFPTDRTEVN